MAYGSNNIYSRTEKNEAVSKLQFMHNLLITPYAQQKFASIIFIKLEKLLMIIKSFLFITVYLHCEHKTKTVAFNLL